MKTLVIPTPKNAQEAAQQARILDRAISLAADGYYWEGCGGLFRFALYKPGSDRIFPAYFVDLWEQKCTCKSFEKRGYCKHYLAVEREALQVEALEARYAGQ